MSIDIGDGVRLAGRRVGPMDNNAYLLSHGTDAVLVDAADAAEELIALVAGHRLCAVVTTHRHADHLGALGPVIAATGAPAFAGAPDVAAIAESTGVTSTGLWDGDEVALGPVRLTVIGLVGHTPGSITLVHSPAAGPVHMFTGDSLFPGGVGRTWRPEDFDSLIDDVERKLFARFADDTVIHPGHGAPTTLGAERPHLAEWRARRW